MQTQSKPQVFTTVVFLYVTTTTITESAILGVYPTRGNNHACPASKDAIPYYFGETDLACMNFGIRRLNRHRRTPPSRFTFKFSHRWIWTAGMYLEFGNRIGRDAALVKTTYPNLGNVCTMTKEKTPAGYTRLSPGCIRSCIENYVDKFGNYSFYTNNCHHFVNKISILLCMGKKCPKWCKYTPEDDGEFDQENEHQMDLAMEEVDKDRIHYPH
uniref:Uncharacterized protein n=1 Tax=Magallana gigas TaxID=29159 RepID=K1RU64_MAGGI